MLCILLDANEKWIDVGDIVLFFEIILIFCLMKEGRKKNKGEKIRHWEYRATVEWKKSIY